MESHGSSNEPRPSLKRYRRAELDEEEEKQKMLVDEDDTYEEYVPLKKRKALEEAKLKSLLGTSNREAEEGDKDADGFAVPRTRTGAGGGAAPRAKESLLVTTARARKEAPPPSEAEKEVLEEQDIMRHITQKQALRAVKEPEQDVHYTRSMVTGWKPPLSVRMLSRRKQQKIREAFGIVVDGHNLPPPTTSFKDMKLPQPILEYFKGKNILKPTPIQIQGVPAALAGRDMIGIASTGTGKTLAFGLPMLMISLQEEIRMPLDQNEGPVALCVNPSKDLAVQTTEVLEAYAGVLRAGGFPELRTVLVVGGMPMREQQQALRRGAHMVVATTGRLKDLLHKKILNLDICRLLALDEADRMVDGGFEEDMRDVLSYFRGQRQTLMFSATMPAKVKAFAESALVDPVEVNVGRAGAANLDVIQEIEYVKEDDKLEYMLNCLQKTAPPVLIFAQNKKDVDSIHEHLLVQGVDVVAVHGDKEQEERNAAIGSFRQAQKDVLVATDVASKGLDFPGVQHVINYDMPENIEDYVHRIGRTGRSGKTGVATTFVNTRQCSESILLDLKHLLKEAKQRVPAFLLAIDDPMEVYEARAAATGQKGCAYCGGLGHRITDCPKMQADAKAKERSNKDYFGAGGFGGEM